MLNTAFGYVGRSTLNLLADTGAIWHLAVDASTRFVQGLLRGERIRMRATIVQMVRAGNSSLPLVTLICFLVGMIMALQSAYQLRDLGAMDLVPSLVAISVTRELAPLLAAIVVAGRFGSAIAAELGTMKISQEIDALTVMGIDPVAFLVVPRLGALIVTLPCLTVFADVIGIVGGLSVSVGALGIGTSRYISLTVDALVLQDIYAGLVKAVAFAGIIGLIGCHQGIQTRGGAEEVGRSTTAAVVRSIVLIIAADLFVTALFYARGRIPIVETPAIEVSALRKSYNGTLVLDGVDLEVRKGETLVILGGSGSGKSTLLRCVVGLERPDEGQVKVQGVDVFDADPDTLAGLRRRMGMAFQAGALFGSMTVAENIELPLVEFTQLPASTRRIVARIKLGMVGLEDAMDKLPSELSGGMRKRAALARALALDPEILFFDEPSAGLDPVTASGLDQLLIKLKEAFGVTLVVVTHEMESAFAIADRLALIHEGRFVIIDTPEAVRKCDNPVVRNFLDRRPSETVDGAAKFRKFIDDLEV